MELTELMSNVEHIVIYTDGSIDVPESVRDIGVQYDHNVTTLVFDCPRYTQNGKDLSKMIPYAHYYRKDKEVGRALCENIMVDTEVDSIIHFTWTLKRPATNAEGVLAFLICFRETKNDDLEVAWHSKLCEDLSLSEGIDCGIDVELDEELKDEITELLIQIKENGAASLNAVQYTPQELTDEQKAQARVNIGAVSEDEVSAKVKQAISEQSHFRFVKVDALPDIGEENVIYLVPGEQEEDNIYEEFLFVDGVPELIGSTRIDLSGYAPKATTLAGYGITDGATKEEVGRLEETIVDYNVVTPQMYNYLTTSAAIQKAIDENEYVLIPNGDYDITSTITIPSDRKIQIEGNVNITCAVGFLIQGSNIEITGHGTINIYSGLEECSAFKFLLNKDLRFIALRDLTIWGGWSYNNSKNHYGVDFVGDSTVGTCCYVNIDLNLNCLTKGVYTHQATGQNTESWVTQINVNSTFQNSLQAVVFEWMGDGSRVHGVIQPKCTSSITPNSVDAPLCVLPQYSLIDAMIWDLDTAMNNYAVKVTGHNCTIHSTISENYINVSDTHKETLVVRKPTSYFAVKDEVLSQTEIENIVQNTVNESMTGIYYNVMSDPLTQVYVNKRFSNSEQTWKDANSLNDALIIPIKTGLNLIRWQGNNLSSNFTTVYFHNELTSGIYIDDLSNLIVTNGNDTYLSIDNASGYKYVSIPFTHTENTMNANNMIVTINELIVEGALTYVSNHMNNVDIHVTATDKENWNKKVSNTETLTMIGIDVDGNSHTWIVYGKVVS